MDKFEASDTLKSCIDSDVCVDPDGKKDEMYINPSKPTKRKLEIQNGHHSESQQKKQRNDAEEVHEKAKEYSDCSKKKVKKIRLKNACVMQPVRTEPKYPPELNDTTLKVVKYVKGVIIFGEGRLITLTRKTEGSPSEIKKEPVTGEKSFLKQKEDMIKASITEVLNNPEIIRESTTDLNDTESIMESTTDLNDTESIMESTTDLNDTKSIMESSTTEVFSEPESMRESTTEERQRDVFHNYALTEESTQKKYDESVTYKYVSENQEDEGIGSSSELSGTFYSIKCKDTECNGTLEEVLEEDKFFFEENKCMFENQKDEGIGSSPELSCPFICIDEEDKGNAIEIEIVSSDFIYDSNEEDKETSNVLPEIIDISEEDEETTELYENKIEKYAQPYVSDMIKPQNDCLVSQDNTVNVSEQTCNVIREEKEDTTDLLYEESSKEYSIQCSEESIPCKQSEIHKLNYDTEKFKIAKTYLRDLWSKHSRERQNIQVNYFKKENPRETLQERKDDLGKCLKEITNGITICNLRKAVSKKLRKIKFKRIKRKLPSSKKLQVGKKPKRQLLLNKVEPTPSKKKKPGKRKKSKRTNTKVAKKMAVAEHTPSETKKNETEQSPSKTSKRKKTTGRNPDARNCCHCGKSYNVESYGIHHLKTCEVFKHTLPAESFGKTRRCRPKAAEPAPKVRDEEPVNFNAKPLWYVPDIPTSSIKDKNRYAYGYTFDGLKLSVRPSFTFDKNKKLSALDIRNLFRQRRKFLREQKYLKKIRRLKKEEHEKKLKKEISGTGATTVPHVPEGNATAKETDVSGIPAQGDENPQVEEITPNQQTNSGRNDPASLYPDVIHEESATGEVDEPTPRNDNNDRNEPAVLYPDYSNVFDKESSPEKADESSPEYVPSFPNEMSTNTNPDLMAEKSTPPIVLKLPIDLTVQPQVSKKHASQKMSKVKSKKKKAKKQKHKSDYPKVDPPSETSFKIPSIKIIRKENGIYAISKKEKKPAKSPKNKECEYMIKPEKKKRIKEKKRKEELEAKHCKDVGSEKKNTEKKKPGRKPKKESLEHLDQTSKEELIKERVMKFWKKAMKSYTIDINPIMRKIKDQEICGCVLTPSLKICEQPYDCSSHDETHRFIVRKYYHDV